MLGSNKCYSKQEKGNRPKMLGSNKHYSKQEEGNRLDQEWQELDCNFTIKILVLLCIN